MISWYFIIGSVVSIPLSLWLILDEWIGHHVNPRYLTTESIITSVCIACFISLFWPVLSVVLLVFAIKHFLVWYDKEKIKRGPQ